MVAKHYFTVLTVALVLACGGSSASGDSDQPRGAESPRSPSGTGGSSHGLRLVTWNLEWLNRKNGTGPVKRSDADYARLRRYVERLDADIIAFQEVDGPEAARRVFPDDYAIHVITDTSPQRTGFAYKKSLRVSVSPDYAALDVGQLRSGADISVDLGSRTLRLMSVHLKSGCFDKPLDADQKDCRKLAAQLPSLEAWIDARGAEGTAAVVLGDFNRRLFAKSGEPFWAEIDDGEPAASDLWSPTEGKRATCWGGKYPDFIDHLVLNKPAATLFVEGSFREFTYDAADATYKGVLSDHCPLIIALDPEQQSPSAATMVKPGAAKPAGGPSPAPQANPLATSEKRIKGNINAKGQRLYHEPRCPDYARTEIVEAKGERWFASAAEAEAAGFARPGNCR